MTENDRNDVLIDSCDAMFENACKMVAMAKEHQTNVMQVIYVDSDGNDAVAYVYDFNFHTWKSADTFDRLAADLLGDANLGTLIAYFNKIAVESEISAGTKIKIPVLSETSNIQGNRIYAMPEKQENYGIDIALNKDGEFETKDGDFASVKGQDNLSQALMLRLTTASENRIRLTSYGIRSAIGDTMAMRSYLLGSIEQTVKADPRIKDIEEISFKGNKSALELEIVYTDINGNDGTHTGGNLKMAKIRRYDEIMEAAKANMIAKQDKLTDFNEGSIIHTFLDTIARLLERAYVAVRQGYNEMLGILPYSIFGFSKKQGLYASGTVIFSREKPLKTASVISKGTVITGGGLTYTTTENGRIEAGDIDSAEIKVVCSTPGMNGNISAKTIESIESTVPSDVVSVRNDNAFTGGSDEETDADFEERFKTYINGLSGTNAYAIRNAALSVNEVRSVSIENHKPPYKDIYNMSIYVDDGSGGASESTIDAVKLAVEGDGTELNQGHVAPGINVRILAPTAVPVNIEMKATVSSIDTSEAEIEIRNVVAAHVNRKVIAQEVVLSEIITKVMALNYVSDCKILSPAENVSLGISQIARLGTFKLTLAEVD